MKRIRGIVAVILAAFLATYAPLSAHAETSAQIKSELESAMEKRDELARSVSAIGAELQDTEVLLEQTKSQIDDLNGQIEQKQEELEQKQTVLASRASANYKAGSASLLELVLESSSFEELCSNLYYANKVSQADAQAISEVTTAKNDLQGQKDSLATLEAQQQQLYDNQSQQAATLKEQQAEQQSYVDSLNADLKAQMKKEDDERIAKEKAQAEAAAKAAAEAAAASSGSSSSTSGGGGYKPSGGGTRQDIIQAGYSQIGVPYVYGAYQPGVALDCSGFSKYCYSVIGITLPHSAAAQAAMAKSVSYDSLQPGDLLFWIGTCPGSHSGSHVAIYLGNNTVIHADGTRVSTGGVWSGWSKAGSIL